MFHRRLHFMATYKSPIARSVWCKQRSTGYWDAAKRGVFGESWWYENLRMSRRTFVQLCTELGPHPRKQVTQMMLPVSVDEQVAVTMWRLATNIEYRTISALFGLGISTVCTIVNKTCSIISICLLPKYVHIPQEQKLREVIDDFENL